MITFAVGVLITVILLVGFGFLATASTVWFFKYRKPHDTVPSPDKIIDISRQKTGLNL
jgi:hypothetical protein